MATETLAGRKLYQHFEPKVYSRNQKFLVCTLQRCVLLTTFCFEFATTTTLAGLVLLRLSPAHDTPSSTVPIPKGLNPPTHGHIAGPQDSELTPLRDDH